MQEAARDMIFHNFAEVASEDEFLEMPRDILASFLQSEYLQIDSEFQVKQSFSLTFSIGLILVY